MYSVKIAAVVLAFCVATGTSMQLPGIKKISSGNTFPKTTTAPPDVHNYNILLTKLELSVNHSTLIGHETAFRVEMYNDTMPVIGGKLYVLQDLPADMQIQVTGYKYSMSNQWMLAFDQGLHLYCEYAETNVSFMRNVLKASDFKECPIKKGVYTIKNMVVDEKEFPPGMPDCKFKIIAKITIGGRKLAYVYVYADITQKDEDY